MAKKSAIKQMKNTVSKKQTSRRKTKKSATSCLKFLKSTYSAIRSHMAAATDLPTFLKTAGALSLNGRKRLVEQALVRY